MNRILFIILVSILVFSAGCVTQEAVEQETSKTIATLDSTIVIQTSTTTTVGPSYGTSTTTTISNVDECSGIADSLNQSVCYFNKALYYNNKTLCEFITHAPSKQLCLQSVGVEEQPTSRIFGNVRGKTPSQPLSELSVSVTSTTRGIVYTGKTKLDGTYSIKVHGGDSYAVTVHYQGKNFTQYINAKRNWEHQVDYILAE